MDQFLYGIPILGARLRARRLPHRDPADHRADHPAGRDADRASPPCAASCASDRASSTSASRARCSSPRSSAGSPASTWRRSSAPTVGPVFGATPALARRARRSRSWPAVVVSLVHAWLSISVKADQIISGTIINIAAFGITGYLNTLLVRRARRRAPGSSSAFDAADGLDRPAGRRLALRHVPQPGPDHDRRCIVIVIVFQILLFRSRWGLRTPGRRRAPAGGRDRRHRRHPAALPERHPRRRAGRPRRRVPEHGGDRLVPARA